MGNSFGSLLHTFELKSVVLEPGGHTAPPQYFADQLTLFGPGRADYPHLLKKTPPNVFHLPPSLGVVRIYQNLADLLQKKS